MNYSTNPYVNPYMSYQNPYMQSNNMQQRTMQNQQPIQQAPQVPIQPIQQMGLQGKIVESIDVVKAIDIPLDGSISYFALADGSGIVTKQLQMDGTSKIIFYKPIDEQEQGKETPKYITIEDFESKFKNINIPDYKEDIKKINRQIEDLTDDVANINKTLKKKKED